MESQVVFKSEIGGAAKINRILKERHKDEIPIFGSSRANGSFVPTILGKNYYNYGIDGTGADVWLFFLEEELKKDKNTPIIINIDLEGLQRSVGPIHNYIPNSNNKEIRDLLNAYNTELPVGIFRYLGTFESYLKDYANERLKLTKEVDRGGSFETNAISKEKFEDLVTKRKNTITAFTNYDSLFYKFEKVLKNTNRQINLVIAPYHNSYFSNYTNYDIALYYLEILDNLPNCKVYNFGKLDTPDSHFMNTSHLNYSGALNFSRFLKKKLSN
jgi:hypothetical protein